MDDVLAYGSSETEHWGRLDKVLRRLRERGVTLQGTKCQFGVKSIRFLGHLVGHDGVRPDPEKVSAIAGLKPPTDRKETRRLVGMCNYLAKFSPRVAELLGPIHAVIGKSSAWVWGPEQEEALEGLKWELCGPSVLTVFDLTKRHRVSADASKRALGAVLLQEEAQGWRPVE